MTRLDEEIKKDIVDELYWDTRIDAAKVNVTVNGGVATLSGEVPTFGDLSAARMSAWQIAGVVDVIDELRVAYVTPPTLPTDGEIESRVNSILLWDPVIQDADVSVTVAGGIVTLEGVVNTHWKRRLVEEKIAGIRGVLNIENKLAVAPTEKIGDEYIAEDVVAALDRDINVSPEDVEVQVSNGVVRLFGTVPHWTARQAAERDASLTAGVVDVQNELRLAA
jgi:osmotically-inducible protein OsmY